jgi:hypothetical protein
LARRRNAERIPFNVDRLLIWLSNVVQFVKCEVVRDPPGAELRPRSGNASRHPLILDGCPPSRVAALRQTSACTFYLVFKEPEGLAFGLAFPVRITFVRGTLQSYRSHPRLSTPGANFIRNFFRRRSLCRILATKKLLGRYLKQFFRPPGRVTLGKAQYIGRLPECQAQRAW